jgi:two-component system NtrC family sensor kinase
MYMLVRSKLALYFLIVVLVSGLISTIVGISLINRHIINRAQNQVRHDLASAWMVYNEKLGDVECIIKVTAERFFLKNSLITQELHIPGRELERVRKAYGFDILTLTDTRGVVIVRTRNPYTVGDDQSNDALVSRALKGMASSATQVVPAKQLRLEGDGLAEKAYTFFKETPKAKPTGKRHETSGMMLKAAAPVEDDNGNLLGVLYGGVLLNRNYEIVDRIKDIVYNGETYEGKDIGTATIFQWDVRISTNVIGLNGNRAIETRVSGEVYNAVLENGRSWIDRAFVVNDWYITAYEPIRDYSGEVIGILYVGILEQPYRAMKMNVIWSMIKYLIIAVVVAMGIALFLGRAITGPIRNLVRATEQISRGSFPSGIEIKSRDEIGTLSESFNSMSRELKQTLDEKDIANEKLRDLNTRYLELLGFVTHELMQPLGVLKGYLIMMEDADPDRSLNPDQRRQAVSTMLRNVNMLIHMSQTYLQLSKLESGALELNKKRVGVYEEIILPVMEDKKPQLTARSISYEMENVEHFQGLEVCADPIMLRIVYDNLVTNAIKYGAKGGRIYFGVQDAGEFLQFNVKNEGEGIPQDKLETIFEKFVRIDGKAEHKAMGTGLGLYNAKEIVRMHGGRIWAESVEGKWANFIFTLVKSEQRA